MLKVSFYLRSSKKTEKGAPIYCEISYESEKPRPFATGHWINPKDWDSKAKKVIKPKGKPGRTLADSINEDLDIIRSKIIDIKNRLEAEGGIINNSLILTKYRGKEVKDQKMTLGNVMSKLVDVKKYELKQKVIRHEKTLSRYEQFEDELSMFIKEEYRKSDLGLDEVKPGFIHSYERWLGKKGKNQSTINKRIQKLRSGITLAFSHGWISYDPFATFRYKTIKPKIKFLTKEELNNLQEHVFASQSLSKVRDIFLFSCYSGMGYSEYAYLEPRHIFYYSDKQMPYVAMDRFKTEEPLKIPLLPTAMAIIKKYKDEVEQEITGKCLPVVSNQKFNKYLQEIQEVVGIDRIKLTSHVGRSTFATLALADGLALETVSKILGHRDLKTTLRYYGEILDEKVFNDVDELIKKIKEKVE